MTEEREFQEAKEREVQEEKDSGEEGLGHSQSVEQLRGEHPEEMLALDIPALNN